MNLKIDDHLSFGYFSLNDIRPLAEFMNDSTIYNNTLTVPYPYTIHDAEVFISAQIKKQQNEDDVDSFALRYDGKIIGCIGFMPKGGSQKYIAEIGYSLSEYYRNKGIMTKTVGFFCNMLFEKNLFEKLTACTFIGNVASEQVLEKNGFVQEGFLSKNYKKGDKYLDCKLYALVKE